MMFMTTWADYIAMAVPVRVVVLALVASAGLLGGCGLVPGVGPASHDNGMHLTIDSPHQDDVVTVRSVTVRVHTDFSPVRLRYSLDGGDLGEGDTTFLVPNLSPGSHRVEVEALHADGSSYSPVFHAGVDFVIQ
jgi:hypothetical protein